ncbi:MAG TPA: 16S rRNA (guanine(527)-N(7))-methyltransferase RsmG [Candidatus Angelobacter sp.]|nr:16S rRNA (guanine(527)-N(7))-methyltransferase RsmG [Candidatus Angelobacter sp.]
MASVDTGEIGRLLKPFAKLDEERLSHTSTYIDLLLKWNARINLTAVRDAQEMVTRHFGESFFVAGIFRDNVPATLIDLGSGAGFPGIPIAMLLPETQITLIEANQKKVTFLREVIFALKLKNISVFAGRGEEYRQQADVVAMRAVERFDQSLSVAMTLVEQRGRLALMIGASQVRDAHTLGPEMEWSDAMAIPGGHSRVLLVGIKKAKVERNH